MWYIVRVHLRKDRTYTMNVKQIFKNMLTDTSVFFTVITPIYAALQMIVNTSEEETAIRASWLLYIFLFSLLGAISMCIYRINTMNKGLRVAIQYGIIALGSYGCFFAPLNMNGSQVLVGLTLVTLLYFTIWGACVFFAWRFKQNSKKEEIYENKFKKLR